MEEMQNKPKVEKISLKELKAEEKKRVDEEYSEKFNKFLNDYLALTPEEKEIFFARNSLKK